MNATPELDSTEAAKLKKILAASGQLEGNMKVAHERCREAFAARKEVHKSLREVTLEALKVAYGTYLAASASKTAKIKFLKVAGLSSSQKTSSLLLNTVIKVAITADRRQASRFGAVIKLAIRGGATVGKFTEFVKSKGGVTRCVKSYRQAAVTSKPVPIPERPPAATIEMGYDSPTVEKALSEALAEAESKAVTLKRQAVITISPEGSCELLKVCKMPKP